MPTVGAPSLHSPQHAFLEQHGLPQLHQREGWHLARQQVMTTGGSSTCEYNKHAQTIATLRNVAIDADIQY